MVRKHKIISLLSVVLIIFSLFSNVVVMAENNDNINVYVTVTDISDYEEPFNVLVKRQKISVSDFDITQYGDTLSGIQTIEGVSYLHALIQLHINLYGSEAVKDNLMLSNEGETKIFMGKNVANVMYKNGKDIFNLPQNVTLAEGDEIQVCLYDEGHSQAVATFDEAKIKNVAVNESIELNLQQHYGHPRDRDPIPGAEIIDEKGRYILNNNRIITTDEDGHFTISFDEPGEYIISAMPEINYYMLDTGGGTKIEWIPQEKVEYIEVTRGGWAPLTKEGLEVTRDCIPDSMRDTITDDTYLVIFQWGDLNPEDEGFLYDKSASAIDYGGSICHESLAGTFVEEKVTVELVPVEVIIPDELLPMVSYTTPLLVIDVTDKPSITKVWLESEDLAFTAKNTDYGLNKYSDLYAVGYDKEYDENGNFICDRMGECQKAIVLNSEGKFDFDKVYDYYKLMIWENNSMTPVTESFLYTP